MPYLLSFNEVDDIIVAEYTPPITHEELGAAVTEAVAMGRETGALRFLGDCSTLPATDDIEGVYELAQAIERAGVDKRVHEALVLYADPTVRDRNFEIFAKLASNNVGIKVKLFYELDDAMDWLRTCPRKVEHY